MDMKGKILVKNKARKGGRVTIKDIPRICKNKSDKKGVSNVTREKRHGMEETHRYQNKFLEVVKVVLKN